jgi:hypothetical protein
VLPERADWDTTPPIFYRMTCEYPLQPGMTSIANPYETNDDGSSKNFNMKNFVDEDNGICNIFNKDLQMKDIQYPWGWALYFPTNIGTTVSPNQITLNFCAAENNINIAQEIKNIIQQTDDDDDNCNNLYITLIDSEGTSQGFFMPLISVTNPTLINQIYQVSSSNILVINTNIPAEITLTGELSVKYISVFQDIFFNIQHKI